MHRHQPAGFETLMMMWLLLLWLRIRASAPPPGWEDQEEVEQDSPFLRRAAQRYQLFIDRLQPRMGVRYMILASVAAMYASRILSVHGFYVVTYALAIYLLKLFILFLQPAVELHSDDEDAQLLEDARHKQGHAGEYRPFNRKLPEFKAWHSACKGICIAYVCTFVPIFDIPVFWPILVLYFVVLFALTIKKQVMHMWRHKYVPWITGSKAAYKSARKPAKDGESNDVAIGIGGAKMFGKGFD